MFISKTLKFYKRLDIQQAMILAAKNKEVAVKYGERGFGRRPDVLQYKNDVLEHAKKGVSSFHCSEEIWYNPLQIDRNMTIKDLDQIRKGWDLVLDIDCKFFEYSKIAAFFCIKVLRRYGIKSLTCKFSGNKGFHIAVPFEAFPKTIGNKETKLLFPETARRIAIYIKHLIKESVSNAILKLEKNDFEKIVKKTGLKPKDIIRQEVNKYGDELDKLDAEPFLDIDTILISSRHLFRMPYSFHEKSQLVSVPIDPDKVLSFRKEEAEPENVVVKHDFLNRNAKSNEASRLIVQAFDFEVKQPKEGVKKNHSREYEELTDAISEKLFPPCMEKILKGLEDGRKRSVFILTNFLSVLGWNHDAITIRLKEWNEVNAEPLREVYLKGQISYHKRNKKVVLPPNCPHASKGHTYYSDINICSPDNLCRKIRNPVQYAKIKSKAFSKGKKPKTKKLVEQK